MPRPVRVALLDDNAVILVGLEDAIGAEPDLEVVGAARSEGQLWPILLRNRPDVAVLDVHHRGRDGLGLCFDIKRWPHAPSIALHAAFVDDELVLAAALSGAGVVISKSSPPALLLEAIRKLARCPLALPEITRETRRQLASRLDPAERAIVAMRLAGDHPAKIARRLGLPPSAVNGRIECMLARLGPAKRAA